MCVYMRVCMARTTPHPTPCDTSPLPSSSSSTRSLSFAHTQPFTHTYTSISTHTYTHTGRERSERLGRVAALLERVHRKIEEHKGDVPLDVRACLF